MITYPILPLDQTSYTFEVRDKHVELNNWGRYKNALVRTFIIIVISCQVVSGIWNQFFNFLFHTYIQTDERYPSC